MANFEIERRFAAVLRERGWTAAPVLLGVSGGSDSTALFRLFLATLGPDGIAVAHLDHGLRETAGRDREFVENLCAEHGVRCVCVRREVAKLAARGESHEAAGRRLRYELYDAAARELGCVLVATGHTRDDLAENTLMNIARGCGLRGLAGMPPRRGVYIRPLLGFYREELRDYLRALGQNWVDDETNELDIYGRNRVRHQIMPALCELVNERAAEHLASLADEAAQRREAQEASSAGIFRLVKSPLKSLWPRLDLGKLRCLSTDDRVELLRWLGRRLALGSLSRGRTDELDHLIVASGRWLFQWGSEVDAVARDGSLTICPAGEKRRAAVELKEGDTVRWGGWLVSLEWSDLGTAADGFCLAAGLEPDRPIVLKKNDGADFPDTIFPFIEQNGIFRAEKKGKRWEICANSVKYTSIAKIHFVPLVGTWRPELWN